MRDVAEDANPCVVAAVVIIQVIEKGPLDAVFENDPHKTDPSRDLRVPLFYHQTPAPLRVFRMNHLIAEFQVSSLKVHGSTTGYHFI